MSILKEFSTNMSVFTKVPFQIPTKWEKTDYEIYSTYAGKLLIEKPFKWDILERKIYLEIEETTKFSILKWIEDLQKVNEPCESSPNIKDIVGDDLTISFRTSDYRKWAILKFKHIELENILTQLNKYNNMSNNVIDMHHILVLSYRTYEYKVADKYGENFNATIATYNQIDEKPEGWKDEDLEQKIILENS